MPQVGAGRPNGFEDEEELPRIRGRSRERCLPRTAAWRRQRAPRAGYGCVDGAGAELRRDPPVRAALFVLAGGAYRRAPKAPFTWDPTHAIAEALALSRLVLDNAQSFEFVGRAIDRSDGHRRIVPLLGYDGRIAYRTRKDRFWLTTAEAEELRALLDRYRAVKDALPVRVRRALWHADRSCYCRYIHEAVTNIATGLEALLNTGEDEPIAAQFVKRSQALARELGIETSRSYWSWLYDVRSRAAHGAESRLVVPSGWDETPGDPPADVSRIAKAQEVLRKAIRNVIEDEGFRGVFESEEAIRARFPLEPSSTDELER